MRIAVIGAGISGLVCAYLLHKEHDIVVFEANDYPGGHTHTHDIDLWGESHCVDTGFIVFNQKTYPNFVRLLQNLGVDWQDSDMSFSVKSEANGLEYKPSGLNSLFAQRSNLLRPAFYRMLLDILRFRKDLASMVYSEDYELSLGQFMDNKGYGSWLLPYFVLPLGSAIWSADPKLFFHFPVALYARFYANHGFLNIRDQPQWLVVKGGSRQYVRALIAGFEEKIRLSSPISEIRRNKDQVEVETRDARTERFDQVILAAHSDQTLSILDDATDNEREILGAIAYQQNRTLLHTDDSVLPVRPNARASWNCLIPEQARGRATLTYSMNRLQSLKAPGEFCVSLNMEERIDAKKVLKTLDYAHPIYTRETAQAQLRWKEISGMNRTHFCGAYWGYGFHEDGVNSALAVCRHFGVGL